MCGSLCVCCNTLQHTATHCNTLQHTVTHCNTLQHSATALQHTLLCVCGSLCVRIWFFSCFQTKIRCETSRCILEAHCNNSATWYICTATVLQHCNAPQIIFNQPRRKQIYNNSATTLQQLCNNTATNVTTYRSMRRIRVNAPFNSTATHCNNTATTLQLTSNTQVDATEPCQCPP